MRTKRREVDAPHAAFAVACGGVRPKGLFRGEHLKKNVSSSELQTVRVNIWRPERPLKRHL